MTLASGPDAIGVDGGGSACRLALIHNGQRYDATTGPANVSSDFDTAIRSVTEGLQTLADASGLDLKDLARIPAHLGLAGVISDQMARQVAEALPLKHPKVTEDCEVALYGALGGTDGAILGVGTGSFAARRFAGRFITVGGHGLTLGDEGSGAWLGRALCGRVLRAAEGVSPHSDLTRDTWEVFGKTAANIIAWAAGATPADFAAHAPGVLTAAGAGDPVAVHLVRQAVDHLTRTLRATGWSVAEKLCLTGGLGAGFLPFLPGQIADAVQPVKGTALDGALALARQKPAGTKLKGLTALVAEHLFDGEHFRPGHAILLNGSDIAGLIPRGSIPDGVPVQDLGAGTLAPGFVDLQVNGGGGLQFNEAPTVETLTAMAAAHASLGATTILPTLITDRPEVTNAAIDATIATIRDGVPGIAGLHLEGPHLAQSRKGAHDGALIRPMTPDDEVILLRAKHDLPVLMVTLAPEAVSPDQIARLSQAGIVISLGHSDADADACKAAFDAGATCATHLFNAMSQLQPRAPGLVGATLAAPDVAAGIIADLIHVSAEGLGLALKAKPDHLFLVSDAMAPAGTDLTEFTLNTRRVLRRNGRLTLQDGTLAGADLTLATAIRNLATRLGTPLETALAMATACPADAARIGTSGRLITGAPADLVFLDQDLGLSGTWQRGRLISGNGAAEQN